MELHFTTLIRASNEGSLSLWYGVISSFPVTAGRLYYWARDEKEQTQSVSLGAIQWTPIKLGSFSLQCTDRVNVVQKHAWDPFLNSTWVVMKSKF